MSTQSHASSRRWSTARVVTVAALVLQTGLTAVLILRASPLPSWLEALRRGGGEALAGGGSLLVLLALIRPAARGKAWALWAAAAMQALLALGIVPYFVQSFAQPADFTPWVLNTTYLAIGVVAAAFGVAAALEAAGRVTPAGVRVLGGVTGRGALLGGAAAAWVGMLTVAAAVASHPPGGVATRGVPEAVVMLPMEATAFTSPRVRVQAGRPTAILLVNRDPIDHRFDLDALGVHVAIPGRSTAVATVTASAPGRLPFYCGVPGHAQVGMTGAIEVVAP